MLSGTSVLEAHVGTERARKCGPEPHTASPRTPADLAIVPSREREHKVKPRPEPWDEFRELSSPALPFAARSQRRTRPTPPDGITPPPRSAGPSASESRDRLRHVLVGTRPNRHFKPFSKTPVGSSTSLCVQHVRTRSSAAQEGCFVWPRPAAADRILYAQPACHRADLKPCKRSLRSYA